MSLAGLTLLPEAQILHHFKGGIPKGDGLKMNSYATLPSYLVVLNWDPLQWEAAWVLDTISVPWICHLSLSKPELGLECNGTVVYKTLVSIQHTQPHLFFYLTPYLFYTGFIFNLGLPPLGHGSSEVEY